ncbi:hypothetical protein FSP39_022782 [Pinctada imbricata]|uniref:Uncharacterized protein n=1 Tax=Pinctada imbricata TaxID=66713 RepID=A0AA88YJG5_PINIB|nr:hypothetical protein FSP39_022782 [Pinctada imbricata]
MCGNRMFEYLPHLLVSEFVPVWMKIKMKIVNEVQEMLPESPFKSQHKLLHVQLSTVMSAAFDKQRVTNYVITVQHWQQTFCLVMMTASSSNSNIHSEILKSSLSTAKCCLSLGRFGRAFANYLLYIKLSPNKEEEVISDFILATREWTEQLERENRIEDLFKCYDQACEVLPDCEAILNNIGAQLFRLGYPEEAATYIRKALQINPNDIAAQENLENLCSHLVERWHFRMLNDVARNIAYTQAIERAVQRGHNSVLDIGTGTGILSLMAVDAGATDIYACDQSRTMCEIAADVLHANRADHKVKLLCKSSTDLKIPQDLKERVSMVVTETFDAALFGENVIPTLKHAWEDLLQPLEVTDVSPMVIPSMATMYVCAIECEIIRDQNRFLYPGLQNLDFGDLEVLCSTGSLAEDPYTTENLSRIHGGYKRLSDIEVLMKVNFNSLEEIDILDEGLIWEKCLHVVKAGRVDAIATWFDLHLIDDMTLTTNPSRNNCWEQAIFPVNAPSVPEIDHKQSLHPKIGDTLDLKFSLNQNILSLLNCHHSKKGNTHNSSEQDGNSSADQDNERNIFYLERPEVSRLNNLHSNRTFCRALEKIMKSQQGKENSIAIMDYSYGLSPLLLQVAKFGCSSGCVVQRDELNPLFQALCSKNGLSEENYTLIDPSEVRHYSKLHNFIVCDLLEPCGVFRQQILEDIAVLRVTALEPGGYVMPGRVSIHGMCVQSEELLAESAVVGDERTLGYHVAKYINDFQMTTHIDITLSQLNYTKLSNPFHILTFDLNEELRDSEPLSFLHMESKVKVTTMETGTLTAIIYWFEFELCEGMKISTLDSMFPWKQAAIMNKSKSVDVLAGQIVDINVTLKNSNITAKFEKIRDS